MSTVSTSQEALLASFNSLSQTQRSSSRVRVYVPAWQMVAAAHSAECWLEDQMRQPSEF